MLEEALPSDRVRQEQAHYSASDEPYTEDRPLRIPIIGGVRDDLKPWQVICWCVIAGALMLAAVGAVLKVNYEIGLSLNVDKPRF